MSNIEEQIEKQRQEAREVCGEEGTESQDCAVAWDTVEELQAEYAHQRSEKPKKTSLEQYCDENPEAAECRVYDD
ncbi:MAG: Calvin cycle protein CP12 [Halothece sp.]